MSQDYENKYNEDQLTMFDKMEALQREYETKSQRYNIVAQALKFEAIPFDVRLEHAKATKDGSHMFSPLFADSIKSIELLDEEFAALTGEARQTHLAKVILPTLLSQYRRESAILQFEASKAAAQIKILTQRLVESDEDFANF